MRTVAKIVKGFSIILTVACLCGFVFNQPLLLANDSSDSRIDRVDQAVRAGRIDLKTAVLQKANILFAPQRAALEGEDIGDETPRLELFEDVRRVFEKLTGEEKDYLSLLSPELARVIDEAEHGGEVQRIPTFERLPNTFDRVSKAQDREEISLKEAVLLKARLLFAPHTIARKHPFSVQAGEVPVQEECLTGFYMDVHRVFDQLTYEEISFLRSLSPDLEVIVTTRKQERAGMVGTSRTSALPSYPDLDQQEEGKNCIVHYTLIGTNACPSKTYAQLVRLYMDKAIGSNMTKHFTKANAEGYADYKGKLHVYIVSMSANGETIGGTNVSGNKWTAYVKINNALDSSFGDTWQLKLKGVCFHEYFHAIQYKYNAWSDKWLQEATAVWASCYYGGDWTHVGSYYSAADSIFNQPDDILWSTAYRMYSTSAFAFFLSDRFGGHKIIKSWLLNTEADGDGVKTLQQALIAKNTVFAEEYVYFLASLYSKKIASIKKYMPDVTFAATYNAYGLDKTAGQVQLTGANFYAFDPETGVQPASFISTFTAGATGVPKGVLVKQKSKSPIAFQPHAIIGSPTAYVGDFGGTVKQVALIVTDADYSTKDTAPRSYEYTAIVPRVVIKEVLAQSPIYSGDSSQIDIRYDLLGTYPAKPFPIQFKVTEKGPDVSDNASGEYEIASGVDQILNVWFNTGSSTVGNYRFTFQFAVPPDSWLPIAQVKSKGKCSVVVEEPPEDTTARQVEAVREIKIPILRIKK